VQQFLGRMSRIDSPTWYEEIIRLQQATNEDLTALCEKQQQLVKYLEGRLEEKGALGALASDRPSSSDPPVVPKASIRDIGPDSAPLDWTGSPFDLIPVVIGGVRCKALILTPTLTKLWKNLLQRDYMLKKYSREYHKEEKNWWLLNGLMGGASSLEQRIAIEEGHETLPKNPGPEECGYEKGQVKAWYSYSTQRLNDIDGKRREVRLRFAHGRRDLFARITRIFRQYEDFKFEKGKWLQELRQTRSTYGLFQDLETSGWDNDLGASNEDTDFDEPLGKGFPAKTEPEAAEAPGVPLA